MARLRIKELLKEKNFSQKELAQILDMTETGLSKMIGDKGNPTMAKLKEVAKILNISLMELFVPYSEEIKGYLDYKGKVYKINSTEDIRNLLDSIKEKNIEL